MRDAALEIASASRDDIDTSAPSAASVRATAYPNPRLAPATIATLFVNPRSISLLRLSCPFHYAIERRQRGRIQLRSRRSSRGIRDHAATPQHFFANRLADAFL